MKRRDFLGMCAALLGAALVRNRPTVGMAQDSGDYGYIETGISNGVAYRTIGGHAASVTFWVKPDGTSGVLEGTIDELL